MDQKKAENGLNSNLVSKIKYAFLFPIVLIFSLLVLLINLYQFLIELGYPIEDDQHEFDIIFVLMNPRNVLILIILVSSYLIFIISIAVVLSLNDYKYYCRKKKAQTYQNHNLSFEEIFESETRKKIIDTILKEPGIHYNDLLRKCQIHRGQLQWHLSVLIQFNIIKKEKLGQYSIFYPIHHEGQNADSKKSLLRSKQSTIILNLIESQPGIYSSKIAHRLNLKRNSVKYHVDKLLKKDLIFAKRDGRRKYLFPTQDIYLH
jgi:predicted transcriptional regulator